MLRRRRPPADLVEFYKSVQSMSEAQLCNLSTELHEGITQISTRIQDDCRTRYRLKRMFKLVTRTVREFTEGYYSKPTRSSSTGIQYNLGMVLSGACAVPNQAKYNLYNNRFTPTARYCIKLYWVGNMARGLKDIFGYKVGVHRGKLATTDDFRVAIDLCQLGAKPIGITVYYAHGKRRMFYSKKLHSYWLETS